MAPPRTPRGPQDARPSTPPLRAGPGPIPSRAPSPMSEYSSSQPLSQLLTHHSFIEPSGSFHHSAEDKALQAAVLASRHGRTEEQVQRIVIWLSRLEGMEKAVPSKLLSAVHSATGMRLLLHQVVYKAGRTAEDMYFVLRGKVVLRSASGPKLSLAATTAAAAAAAALAPGGQAQQASGAAAAAGAGAAAAAGAPESAAAAAAAAAAAEPYEPASCVEVHAGAWFGEAELLAGCKRLYTAAAAENGSIVLKMTAQAYSFCMEPFQLEEFEAKVLFLSHLAPLKGLPMAEVQRMAPCFQTVAFKQGEVLVRQGERADAMFAIKEGTCCVVLDPKFKMDAPEFDGRLGEIDAKKTIQVCVLSSSASIIGEAAIHTTVRRRTASVIAYTYVQAYRIHRSDLLRCLPADQLEVLRLIAYEKVSMMDASVTNRQHMKDQILHGRHLREISLEQQRVQQQRKGMPAVAAGAPGHEEYWQMMTVLRRYKRPAELLDAGAPNMMMGMTPHLPSQGQDAGPSLQDSGARLEETLAWDEQLIMAELKLETGVVVLEPMDTSRSNKHAEEEAEHRHCPESCSQQHQHQHQQHQHQHQQHQHHQALPSTLAFSRALGGLPGGDFLAADGTGAAPLWRPVVTPPVNTRAAAAAASPSTQSGPLPVSLQTLTAASPGWGTTSRNRSSASRSPLRQVILADLANCWQPEREHASHSLLSRSSTAAHGNHAPGEAGGSFTAPRRASVPIVSSHAKPDAGAPLRSSLNLADLMYGAAQPAAPPPPLYVMSGLLKGGGAGGGGGAGAAPLSARPTWGYARGAAERPPVSVHIVRGSTAAAMKAAAAQQAEYPPRPSAADGFSPGPARPTDSLLEAAAVGDPRCLNLLEFSILPTAGLRLGTPTRGAR